MKLDVTEAMWQVMTEYNRILGSDAEIQGRMVDRRVLPEDHEALRQRAFATVSPEGWSTMAELREAFGEVLEESRREMHQRIQMLIEEEKRNAR